METPNKRDESYICCFGTFSEKSTLRIPSTLRPRPWQGVQRDSDQIGLMTPRVSPDGLVKIAWLSPRR